MFTVHDEAFYDPETDELQRFYGPEEPEDRCAECDAPVLHEVGGSFCSEDCGHQVYYEPDPDAYAEDYYWRSSSL